MKKTNKRIMILLAIVIGLYLLTPTSEVSRECNYNTCACKVDLDCIGTCEPTGAPGEKFGSCENSGKKDDKVDPAKLGGVFTFKAPEEVKPESLFTIEGTFKASAGGSYLLEAGPIECPGGCEGNVYSVVLFQASKSACDGNVHYAGKKVYLNSGDVAEFDLNVRAPNTVGTYTYAIGAYTNCFKDGGEEIVRSRAFNIDVKEDAPVIKAKEITDESVEPGTVDNLKTGFTDIGDWIERNKDNKLLLYSIAAIAGIFLIMFAFKEDEKNV